MARINDLDELDVTVYSKSVTKISTIYNNKFIQRLYVGMTYKQAIEKFKAYLQKGESL